MFKISFLITLLFFTSCSKFLEKKVEEKKVEKQKIETIIIESNKSIDKTYTREELEGLKRKKYENTYTLEELPKSSTTYATQSENSHNNSYMTNSNYNYMSRDNNYIVEPSTNDYTIVYDEKIDGDAIGTSTICSTNLLEPIKLQEVKVVVKNEPRKILYSEEECDIFSTNYNDEVLSNKKADKIVISKSNRVLVLLDKKGKIISRHRISLGRNSIGRKVKKGDLKTPEGDYHITYKGRDKKYYKHLSLSYPNKADRLRSKKLGFNPGGGITIHAQVPSNWSGKHDDYTLARNWTKGCIAMTNKGIDMIWKKVSPKTKVEIRE